MTVHEFAWLFTVAFVYLACVACAAMLLVADWRMTMDGYDIPKLSVLLISLLGPIGFLAATSIYFLDLLCWKHSNDHLR